MENLEKKQNQKELTQKEIDSINKKFDSTVAASKKQGSFSYTIVHYYWKFKKFSILIFLTVIIAVLCAIAIPLLTYQMTTDISYQNSISAGIPFDQNSLSIKYWYVGWKTLLYISLGVVGLNMISMFCSNVLQLRVGKKMEIELRNNALINLLKLDISYYSDKKIGEILTKIISDTQVVGDQASQVPVAIIQSFFQVIAGVTMMFIFDATMSAITLSTFVLILVLMSTSYVVVRKRIANMRQVITEVNGDATDKINTIRLIKSSGTEIYEAKNFRKEHHRYFKSVKKLSTIQAFMVTVLFGGISAMQFASIGSAMALHGGASDSMIFFSTTFAAYNLAQGVMISPLFQIVMSAVGVAQASVSGKRVNEIITADSRFSAHYINGQVVEGLHGNIEFKNVEFNYPEKPNQLVLPLFNHTFEEGKSYAFVGETGSGKSTIAKLLLRFYDPTKGDVLINDGKFNLRDIKLSSYLNDVGYVEQEPQIMFGDVFMNVKYGKFDATNEDVIEACKKAELDTLIQSWPDGYNTILGERGFMLSGGQKQRLVIARMFLKNPKLLILDEATSALDNIVEKEIQEKLETLMKGRTTVSIAHRLSTIKNCDQIIVLAPGKGVVQIGKFDELKNKKGHFKDLYEAGEKI